MLLAPVTTAWVAPKKTILLAGVGLKFCPVIVTVVLIGPLAGLNEVITGGNTVATLRKSETVPPPLFATAISGLPSAFMSPTTRFAGLSPVV